ncbi:hypothetical protein HVX64_17695 [Citrobacter sp. RHB20-C16]|uniref:hypothetical protein n=1 Tax=unclassified Citrobacter TaxID=2644389 RepID=UPI0015EAA4CA|nr:hypothetical protein HVX64_17695 [Citrobacter sp. RHB20-C16]QMK84120.1 hypothetical protein HVX63_17705 [Citrobacter sp. RHB20-C15]
MKENELKHVIALLLEDAKRVQQIEPNTGTESRILLAQAALKSAGHDKNEKKRLNGVQIVEALLERRKQLEGFDRVVTQRI